MKRIIKNEEPQAFSNWKEQEAENLENYYAKENADAAWRHIPSNPPKNPEKSIQYYSKKELIEEQLKEQGFICCYCNREIHQLDPIKDAVDHNDRRTTIEHLDPKEADVRNNTYRYNNLVSSCSSGERKPKPRFTYCSAKRGNKPIAFKPTDENCEELVHYSINGGIFGESSEITKTLHDVLGLEFFNDARKAEIRGYYYANSEEHDCWEGEETERPPLKEISPENAMKIIEALSRKGSDGKQQEFCSAIIYVLKNDILNEKK